MSDARQAIAVAKKLAQPKLASRRASDEAEAYLSSAQKNSRNVLTHPARRDALLAKDKALDALARAEGAVNDDRH